MTVRPAAHGDLEAVLALARDFVLTFKLDEKAFRTSFPVLLALPDTHFSVAEKDGRVIGYLLGNVHLTIYANGLVGWVDEIMIHADSRRSGIGRELLEDFENWAAARGARLVSMATTRAAPFYLALGYKDAASYFKKELTATI